MRSKLLLLAVILLVCQACQIRETAPTEISLCTFNIQFLGHFKDRDNQALSEILKDYDIVVIQELVAPPVNGIFPDSSLYELDEEASAFAEEMEARGFIYLLSEEDTGAGETIHKNSSATEWWITFYKEDVVVPCPEIPHGFLSEDRSANFHFDRVPYGFSFRSIDGKADFTLISVHLKPGKDQKQRRKEELTAINDWITSRESTEKDYIILGDMNIENREELLEIIPPGYRSLNDDCLPTNTNTNSPKPYDHVLYNPEYTSEIDEDFDLEIINLITEMQKYWTLPDSLYPGDPYDHNEFRTRYSDHHPLVFKMTVSADDDD